MDGSKLYISREELYKEGLRAEDLRELIKRSELIKINRRYFENPYFEGEKNKLLAVAPYAPKGIVCLSSAAIYHGLMAGEEQRIDVALPRKSRMPVSPEDPKMKFYLFTGERYRIGITTIHIGHDAFKIYDPEKTVCDLMFYRNKIGIDLSIGVLKQYLGSEKRDANKLMDYAKKLRCGKLLYEYLEVLL